MYVGALQAASYVGALQAATYVGPVNVLQQIPQLGLSGSPSSYLSIQSAVTKSCAGQP